MARSAVKQLCFISHNASLLKCVWLGQASNVQVNVHVAQGPLIKKKKTFFMHQDKYDTPDQQDRKLNPHIIFGRHILNHALHECKSNICLMQ